MVETALLAAAVACAALYGAGIAILLTKNRHRTDARLVAVGAVLAWPALFFMSYMQLVFIYTALHALLDERLNTAHGAVGQVRLGCIVLDRPFFGDRWCLGGRRDRSRLVIQTDPLPPCPLLATPKFL